MVYWRGCIGAYAPTKPSFLTMRQCFDKKELGDIMKRNRRRMKKSATLLLTILISIFFVSTASAAWVPLTELEPISSLPGGVLVVGDKEFSGFEVTGIAQGGALIPNADSVLIQGGQDSETGNYGVRFRLDWTAGSNQTINANINFQVSILPDFDEWFIEDAVLFLAVAGATGTGVVSASENIYDADFLGNSLAALSSSRETGDGGVNLIDSSYFQLGGQPAQVKYIWVRTGIIITGGTSGTAQLSEVFELYSQVPEPATVLLLGLGALALLRKRRV